PGQARGPEHAVGAAGLVLRGVVRGAAVGAREGHGGPVSPDHGRLPPRGAGSDRPAVVRPGGFLQLPGPYGGLVLPRRHRGRADAGRHPDVLELRARWTRRRHRHRRSTSAWTWGRRSISPRWPWWRRRAARTRTTRRTWCPTSTCGR